MPTQLISPTDSYLADFERLDANASLHDRRRVAFDRFSTLGFPTTRDEEWRHTSLKPFATTPFARAAETATLDASAVAPWTLGDTECRRLVFVNGRFCPTHSALRDGSGAHVGALASWIADEPARLEPLLIADHDRNAFTALNTAFLNDGAIIHLPRGVDLELPVHLLFIADPSAGPVVSHPRIVIAAEPGSRATIIEQYISAGPGVAFTNTVTEITSADDATIDHYKVVQENEESLHISSLWTRQTGAGALTSHNFSIGGRIVRNDIEAALDAEGCDTTFNGLFLTRGSQHVDNHLRIEHRKPNCNSWEFYKGVLDEKSSGVFTGRIFVAKDAQKTDAKQTSMNLLLSDTAKVTTKPQLEIFADDVKCTHGATIGQIEETQLFYLQSRGIDRDTARSLLIYAFANETISEVKIEGLRSRLEQVLFTRLPQGERLHGGL